MYSLGDRSKEGAEMSGLLYPNWGLGALARAPLTEMPVGGPRELAWGVPGIQGLNVRECAQQRPGQS